MICKGTVITTKVAITGVCVAGHLASAAARGTAATLKTVNQALDKASCKDLDGLEKLIDNNIHQIGVCLDAKVRLADELQKEAYACINDKSRKFLTIQNAKRIAGVISLGGLVAGGISAADLLDADEAYDTDIPNDNDIDTRNVSDTALTAASAKFDGNVELLEKLTSVCEIDGTENLENNYIVSYNEERERFLRSHGSDSVHD